MTNTLYQLQDDYFDKQLDELINHMTDDALAEFDAADVSADENDENKGLDYDSFCYEGYTYIHPSMGGTTDTYSLIDFTLMFQGEKVSSNERKKHFVLSDSPEREIRLLLSGYDVLSADSESFSPHVSLYREGNSSPLSSITCAGLDDDNEHAFCLHTKKALTAGRYFLYFSGAHCSTPKHGLTDTGDGLCCSFQLLPDGKKMKKPFFDHTLLFIGWTQRTFPDAWNRGTIRILADTLLPYDGTTEVEYALFCFNQDLALMGRPMVCGKLQLSPEFHLKSRKPWMQGTYTVVAVCNREPVAKIKFEISAKGEIENSRIADLPSDDFYYKYVRALENPSLRTDNKHPEMPHPAMAEWNGWDICEIQGLGEEKRKLLHLYLSRRLAEKNGHHRPSEVVLFTGQDEETAFQTAKRCENILSVGRRSVNYIDVADEESCRSVVKSLSKEKRIDQTFILYHNHFLPQKGNPLLKILQEATLHPDKGITLVLCLSEQALKTFQRLYPEIVGQVGAYKHIRSGCPSMTEQAYQLLKAIHASGMKFTKELQCNVLQTFTSQWEPYHLSEWTDYEDWLKNTVEPAMRQRIGLRALADITRYKVTQTDLQLDAYWHALRGTNAALAKENTPEKDAFEEAMSELNNMVGLHSLKNGLSNLFTLLQFAKQRRRLGLPCSEKVPRYLLFTGNPGTGKTTVAKLFGKIYHSMGLLSDGEVVVTERNQLVGDHIGSTEANTRAVLDATKGKVLFIDEAYTLCDSTHSRVDFGYRVIETLLTVLNEEQSDRVIIMAGYKEEMQQLMQANRGLESRFNYHYEFEDYSVEELMQIAENKLTDDCYQLTPAAREALLQLISEAVAHKNSHFGNARWVLHRIADGIMPAMARRVMQSQEKADLTLYTHILQEDVLSAKEMPLLTKAETRQRIGFLA